MIRASRPKIHPVPTPLQAVADRNVTRFTAAILASLQKVRASAPFGEIKDRLSTDPGSVHLLPDWSKFHSVRKAASAEDTYINIIVDAAKTVPEFRGSFALSNQRAVDLAARQAAGLAYGMSADSQAAIRTAISVSMQGNYDTRQAALLIRDSIGLTPARVQAVASYRAALDRVAAGTSDASVVSNEFALSGRVAQNLVPGRVDQLVDQYALRQLQDRALLVARTETMSAANLGQLELWREAADKGLIDRASSQRVWVTTEDDRTCPECEAMDGVTTSIDGGYDDATETPPLHPNCRCTESLTAEPGSGNANDSESQASSAAFSGLDSVLSRFPGDEAASAQERLAALHEDFGVDPTFSVSRGGRGGRTLGFTTASESNPIPNIAIKPDLAGLQSSAAYRSDAGTLAELMTHEYAHAVAQGTGLANDPTWLESVRAAAAQVWPDTMSPGAPRLNIVAAREAVSRYGTAPGSLEELYAEAFKFLHAPESAALKTPEQMAQIQQFADALNALVGRKVI